MSTPHVYTLTWCRNIELLYGSTLVFKTLRTGFPSAQVHVIDGNSIEAARWDIQTAAKACEAEYLQLNRRLELAEFIAHVLTRQQSGSAVFVDPDVCFWNCVEQWQFAGLAAGRFIPRHFCDFSGCLSEPRLHTSLLWVPDVGRLIDTIARTRATWRYFEPFRNTMLRVDDRWRYFDTAAGLYSVFPDEMDAFGEWQLDAYDHLFAGTYADTVLAKLDPQFGDMYRDLHRTAQVDFQAIKGCWRQQERYFQLQSCLAPR